MSTESLAGWIFADLLLILFLVGLGSAVAVRPPEPPPERVTAEPPKPPKPERKIVGMQTEPRKLPVTFDPKQLASGNRALCGEIRKKTRKMDDQRAALVLVFGGGAEVGIGQDMARGVARQLTCANRDLFPAGTPARPFWDGGLQQGSARLEIFLYTTSTITQ